MNTLVLLLVIGLSLASFGVAMWTWWALGSVSQLEMEFGGFEAKHFEIK